MKVNTKLLILGSSSISDEVYSHLAVELGRDVNPNGGRALNPEDTTEFKNELVGTNNQKAEMIFERACQIINDADFIVIDLSAASTGVGVEAMIAIPLIKSGKKIAFIAKEGTKISPHIVGVYKTVTEKDIEVQTYKTEENMIHAVKRTDGYQEYKQELENSKKH